MGGSLLKAWKEMIKDWEVTTADSREPVPLDIYNCDEILNKRNQKYLYIIHYNEMQLLSIKGGERKTVIILII